jgi:radical SAM protein with 4Fe4S-binding SPASM domain
MSEIRQMHQDTYLAVRGDFILKVDGGRPILYPLDNADLRLHILTPTEGLILSLLTGYQTLGEVERLVERFFPDADPQAVVTVLDTLNTLVVKNRTASGIGQHGLLDYSSSPIDSVHRFDPRDFVISPSAYEERLSNHKARRRLEVPISTLCVFTSRCSTNCVYCYAERKRTPEMSLSRWRELIFEMKNLGIQLCAPDNGDVFAREEGIDFCEALLENNFHFLLSTKCYVSADYVRRLVDAGLAKKVNGIVTRTVQLSIDAVDENVQRRLYGVSPIHQRTAKTFDNFLSVGIVPRIKAVITGLNVSEPKALVDYFYPRGARQFHFMRYSRSFFRHVNELFLTDEQIKSFRRQYEQIHEQYPDVDCWQDILRSTETISAQTVDRKTLWQNRAGCGGGWLSLGIAADGRAFLCEQMAMSDKFVVGDLSKQSIMEVWNSEKMIDFIYPPRSRFEGTICHSCDEFEPCMWEQGRCYRDAYFCYGTIYDAPPLCPYNTRPGLRLQ